MQRVGAGRNARTCPILRDHHPHVRRAGRAAPSAPLHAYYEDDVGIFAIDLIELIAGDLPQRQRRLVEAWAEIHQAELLAAWAQLQTGRPAGKIEPLR